MSKFSRRTLRTLLLGGRRPFFAHLAVTHRCNLRCHFCRITQERITELDTEGMKRVIDKLDHLGVAILSVSGGGEPLLRRDFIELVNYAAAKGLYTKVTSNGTMPTKRYRELLDSRISEISISLDGVRGNDLPNSHCGPKILQTIRFLQDNLPADKTLVLNITVSQANRDQVDDIVSYCTQEFPKARLWLNPVVVGNGKLSVPTEQKVNPDFLRAVKSPTLLTPRLFKEACENYYRTEKYNWGCLAGELFFDVKPNGDLWICQDHAAREKLNILDPQFERKYRNADFSHRRDCSGCTYSCYLVTQKCFEPKSWPGLSAYWWNLRTRPEEPCRQTAQKHGWAAGLLHFCASRAANSARLKLGAATASLVLILLLLARIAAGQTVNDPEAVLTALEQHNATRQRALLSYTSRRRYVAENVKLGRKGFMLVEADFKAPANKELKLLERGGSDSIYKHLFKKLLEAELVTASEDARRAAEISRENFRFVFSHFDDQENAYVFTAEPRTSNRFLFKGTVWINAEDFAVQRVQGEPAQRPSFWVRRTHFVRRYGKFGDFWFPVSHESDAELRLLGHSTLGINYFDYQWVPNPATVEAEGQPQAVSPVALSWSKLTR